MRSFPAAVVFAGLAAVLLSGCGSGRTPASVSPAATLYVLDHARPPTAAQVKPYQLALKRVARLCHDDVATVAHYTAGTVKQIADDTGVERTALAVLLKFPKTMSPSLTCTQKFTAYALLLEGNG